MLRCVGGALVETAVCNAAAGERCTSIGCVTPCDTARSLRSYIGCEYWSMATPTPINGESFGLVASSQWDVEVRVTVEGPDAARTGASAIVAEVVVPPHTMVPILLPWDPYGGFASRDELVINRNVAAVLPGAAYHVTSTLPVVVYQFTPLQDDAGATPRQSADATLLLPVTALGNDYIGIAWSSHSNGPGLPGRPGFLEVVASEDDTEVAIELSAFVQDVVSPMPTVGLEIVASATAPGETLRVRLRRGDVLKVLSKNDFVTDEICTTFDRSGGCTGGPRYDLSGSRITASKPVAVYGGHYCTFVPHDRGACDHLEEQLLPTVTWSRSAFALPTESRGAGMPDIFRIVSAEAGNALSFEPASAHGPVTLGVGEYLDVPSETPFRVSGTGRLVIAQYLVGFGYLVGGVVQGDPSLGVSVPIEQFRRDYDFLAPRSFPSNYVNVVAPDAAAIQLDLVAIPPGVSIEGTGFTLHRVPVGGGPHHIEGDLPFGITVYGYAPATSYLYMGGLDLEELLF